MNRVLRQFIRGGLLASLSAAGAAGCVDNSSSLFVQGVMIQQPPDCSVTASAEATLLFDGVMDLALTTEWRGPLLVGNQFMPRGNKQTIRAETMRVIVRGAEIVIKSLDETVLGEFTVPATGVVSPERSENAGYDAVMATLIPTETGQTLRSELEGRDTQRTVVVDVRVFGDTLGGKEVDSAWLSFPIRVCWGCSIYYPPDALVEEPGGTLACSGAGSGQPQAICNIGQEATDCRICSGLDICRYPYGAP